MKSFQLMLDAYNVLTLSVLYLTSVHVLHTIKHNYHNYTVI